MDHHENGKEEQFRINIHCPAETRILKWPACQGHMSLFELREKVKQKVGPSPRIHLYSEPIAPYSKLAHIRLDTSVKDLMRHHHIAITHNNTQFSEESVEYNRMSTMSQNETSLEVVLQICQENGFVHECYRLQTSSRLGFFREMCARYGHNVYLLYYNALLPLTRFSDQQVIAESLCSFKDHMNRVIVGVDNLNTNLQDVAVLPVFSLKIDEKNYRKVKMEHKEKGLSWHVVDKKCQVECLKGLLEIYYGKKVTLQTQEELLSIQIGFEEEKIQCCPLPRQINDCCVAGIKVMGRTCKIYILEKSSILHTISLDIKNNKARCLTNGYLPSCVPSNSLDEDLGYVFNNFLITYSITINMIKLKYFSLEGELSHIQVFPWHQKLYGQILFATFDLFCVRLSAKTTVRVFYVHDAENFVDVGPCDSFYAAKKGYNSISDGSGVFAITHHASQTVTVYSLYSKKPELGRIKIGYRDFARIQNIMISTRKEEQNKYCVEVAINMKNEKIIVYRVNDGKTDHLINVLCDPGMTNICMIDSKLLCSYGTSLKVFQLRKQSQWGWGEKIRIPAPQLIPIFATEGEGSLEVALLEPNIRLHCFKGIFVYDWK